MIGCFIALLPWRWQAHILARMGHSVPYIAITIGRLMNEAETALYGEAP
jgi:hypothetical protein